MTAPPTSGPRRMGAGPEADARLTAVVVGGGLAGVSAATVLAERGVSVVLAEREPVLGGRVSGWADRLSSGDPFTMERGFHAFFRQYYNLRALLRRIDPELSFLQPLADYPILGPEGQRQSFAGLPRRPPWNVVALTRRTPTLGWRDLLRVDAGAALAMLRYEPAWTYQRFDDRSAADYLDSLRFPAAARRMLFDVFAHSFFNPEERMSAGELLMMFHFYFAGNPEGLVFDVSTRPFPEAIWDPMAAYLAGRDVDVRTACPVSRIARRGDGGWTVGLEHGSDLTADLVVLALNVAALQALVAASPDLDDPRFRADVAGLAETLPFAVWRLWLDRPAGPERAPFAGTTGLGGLDNISLYERFDDHSRTWADRHGGSVVELHAYAVPTDAPEASLRSSLLDGLHRVYPELADARTIDERFLMRHDCPAFGPGSFARRPTVATAFDGVALAGDFIKLPFPSALMERAVSSGFLAANRLLSAHGLRPEPIRTVPRRGLLGRRPAALAEGGHA